MKGFSLIEVLAGMGILIISISLAIAGVHFFKKESDLTDSAERIINVLRLAQNKTLASEGASKWGVYFDNGVEPDQYTFYKGENYASRDVSFDEIFKLSQGVEIYEINLAGGGNEVFFERLNGRTAQSGDIYLRLRDNFSKTKKINIQSSGKIFSGTENISSDANRLKDSRHVNFNYSRPIVVSAEKLILTFNYDVSPKTEEIAIANEIKDGQIYWEGEVSVGGENQKIKIHTKKLNNPDTEFSLHRDRRYNTKSLKVEISGDATGNLIRYDSYGAVVKGTSIYVSEPVWQ